MSESNSKLTLAQKEWLRHYKKQKGENVAFATSGPVTVVVRAPSPGLNFAHFGVAIASPNEKKVRRKVGEYHALRRVLALGQPVNMENFSDVYAEAATLQDTADSLAEVLNGFR